ncbi:MAG: RNA polymerase sigma factor [Flavobacteriales bacterium]|jgi:RNA polymerase sigma-70 factor (ECF subfamily)|nr:RNA polymerase sigma factor [Flavobacteriales bacterium]|tara:strand:+ start:42 stop:647 length:606 start_codon:yes stop_codon:yes gene_type:complete
MRKYTSYSDNELMQLVVDKDSRAFSELYDRYSQMLANYFFKMLWQDEEKAQDFMQDLFTKIIEKPHLFDLKRNFKTWMFSVANNMCKNEYRKQSIRKNTSYDMDEGYQIKDNQASALDSLQDSLFSEKLTQELELLDEKQKSTFVMRYFQDMSIKEIAQALDLSEGTVKSRLFYTLKKLTVSLKDFAPQMAKVLLLLIGLN